MEAQEEKVFFNEREVTVTNTRFILPGQKTYAMSGVTAVKTSRVDPKRLWPVICAVVGAYIAYKNQGINAISFIFMAVGLVWFFVQKTIYFVVLSTSSGEQQALQDTDFIWISKVVTALNESIIYRG